MGPPSSEIHWQAPGPVHHARQKNNQAFSDGLVKVKNLMDVNDAAKTSVKVFEDLKNRPYYLKTK